MFWRNVECVVKEILNMFLWLWCAESPRLVDIEYWISLPLATAGRPCDHLFIQARFSDGSQDFAFSGFESATTYILTNVWTIVLVSTLFDITFRTNLKLVPTICRRAKQYLSNTRIRCTYSNQYSIRCTFLNQHELNSCEVTKHSLNDLSNGCESLKQF